MCWKKICQVTILLTVSSFVDASNAWGISAKISDKLDSANFNHSNLCVFIGVVLFGI